MLARGDTSLPSAPTTKQVSLSAGAGDSDLYPMVSVGKIKNNKRRFDDQQIRRLESTFEAESRPELQIKQQLANDLGLQPRQVATWFQNKRARSKSKRIEKEYNHLKTSYDALASEFNSLKKENQCLLIQLQRLRNLMGQPQESTDGGVAEPQKNIAEEYDNTNTNCEAEHKTNLLLDYNHPEIEVCKNLVEHFGEETDVLNMEKLVRDTEDSSFSSSGNWSSFESNFESTCVLDQPSCSSQWWDL